MREWTASSPGLAAISATVNSTAATICARFTVATVAPGTGAPRKCFDRQAVTELRLDFPVRRDRPEVHDADVPARWFGDFFSYVGNLFGINGQPPVDTQGTSVFHSSGMRMLGRSFL